MPPPLTVYLPPMLPFERILFLVFIACASWHIFWIIIKSVVIAAHRNKKQASLPEPVSVIVFARNEEKNLRKLVPLLLRQDHPQFEVVIILDRCFDKSLDYLKSVEAKHSKLRVMVVDYVPDQFHPRKFGLTLAIKGAKYEWVLVTEADCRPTSARWARNMAVHFVKGNRFVLGYSPYFHQKSLLNEFIQYETFTTAFDYLSMTKLGMPYMGTARNMAHRRSQFLSAKGFNGYQDIKGGEDDLYLQRNAKGAASIVIGKDNLMMAKPKQTWKAYFAEKKSWASVGRHYKKRFVIQRIWGALVHASLWASFIILVLLKHHLFSVLYVFAGIFMLKILLFFWSAQKMGQGFRYWMTPVLDFTHAMLNIGTFSSFRKHTGWK